ncbi:MAG: molybdopterin-guanine dinucleotide biosynthesis protein B [Syntrophaceae bacterium]|jgi:molybdopterin-guanine dinucleotide biosynthesis protein MobB|nr:molybdopterin-guanine dinucleotide biosynthesis protein B [Syntrophaceae bacterium]HOC59879.1 molybdopterin-guanine dinucleotide biosynthesis protein B [Smithellaceae bacterium]HQM44816.1 molybdopterin-guanine dinucleotide biosynthesis protein B [Smithellaceae bacterium]
MKVISIVGTKKTGKTTLACQLVGSLKRHGKVGTVKNMVAHPVDSGDTKRHFDAGADVVIGIGEARLKLNRNRGDLASALAEMETEGMDFTVVEGFKQSSLPKFVLADIEVNGCLRKLHLSEINDEVITELTDLVLNLEDYQPPS